MQILINIFTYFYTLDQNNSGHLRFFTEVFWFGGQCYHCGYNRTRNKERATSFTAQHEALKTTLHVSNSGINRKTQSATVCDMCHQYSFMKTAEPSLKVLSESAGTHDA